MFQQVRKIVIIFFILCSLLFVGCSSSSQSQRYNRVQSEDSEDVKGARFTSADDEKIIAEENKTYPNYVHNDSEFDEYPVEEIPVDNVQALLWYLVICQTE